MNPTNNNTPSNNEAAINSGGKAVFENHSAKDKVMEDGKLTFWEILYVARYFLPPTRHYRMGDWLNLYSRRWNFFDDPFLGS